MRIKWLWILCGIYAIAWGDCTQSGNDIDCGEVKTGESVSFKVEKNSNLKNAKVSGGTLTITFDSSVTKLTTTSTITVSNGTMSVNCEKDETNKSTYICKDSNAIFEIVNSANAGITISGGEFKSAYILNSNPSSTSGIQINGGKLSASMLENSGNLKLNNNGTLNTKMLLNKSTANFGGGNSDITSLLNNDNNATLTISGSSTNNITYLSNEKGTATISGGTNTISILANNNNLTISGGTNTITDFRNQSGTATISGGTNNIITKLSNSANLTISGGTNNIMEFYNEKSGKVTISNGTNKIKQYFYNNGELDLKNSAKLTLESNAKFHNYGTATLESGATLTLDSTASFDNVGTLKGSGTISGGIFNHYGNFDGFTGKFNGDMNFNNYTNLTLKNSGGDLASLNVKSFGNYYSNSNLSLESTLTTKGFTNGLLASFYVKSNGNLTINAGGKQTISCNDNNPNCPCATGQKTCNIDLVAQNAGGFFTLESGKVDSKIDFSNTGYLTLNGGEFSVATDKALKNQSGGVIMLKDGTIKGNVENISGSFSMSGGTIENTLKNNGNFTLKDGTIKGGITNEGGNFAISGGTTSGEFKNQVREIKSTDSSGNENTTYTPAKLTILGTSTIATLTNESKNGHNSVISIEDGTLTSTNLTNTGLIQALSGSLNATTLLNNNGGSITAYSGGTITAQSFQWGNGIVNYINGNNGDLYLKSINTISTNSKLNMDFSLAPLVFGAEYKVIKTNSSSATNFTITSNVESNLQDSKNLTFNKSYKDGYIVISTAIDNANAPLRTLLSTSALQTLGETTNQFDALKRIDNNEVLSNIISNPDRVATELKTSNANVATNHTKNSHLNLATSLNTLNRLNKHSTPRRLAFSDMLKPNYRFSLNTKPTTKPKNPLVRFANFSDSDAESIDDNGTFTLEDLRAEHKAEVEAAKLKYNQLIDYTNNLYASIFGIFGDFGGIKTNAYGLIAGYDTKIGDRFIVGANLSYANVSKAHNIGVGGYGRAFVLNNEIDFGLNLNYALTEYATQMLGNTQSAKFSSFGLNANVEYGYLFNVYKTQFFKPFGGLNLYYSTTPSYAESGKYGRAVDSQHSVEMSFDLGAEYRLFLKKYYYLFAQIRFEQFVLNASNGLNMSFVGDSERFEFSKYKGYKNYLQFLLGGDFALIKDTLNITANVGYKMTIAKSSIKMFGVSKEINESYVSVSAGIKYLF